MENKSFNERLKDIRKGKGLTQAQVANALGMKLNTYAYMEKSGKRPSIDMLQKLSALFLVSINDLTGDKSSDEGNNLLSFKEPPKPTVFSFNDVDDILFGKVKEKPPTPCFLKDLCSCEQDMVLMYRMLPESEKAKIDKYITKAFKGNLRDKK